MNIWDIAIDFGIVSFLIILCKLIRVRSVMVQKAFMPVALIAGFFGLILGPNIGGVLPFSNSYNGYGGFLIAIIFGAIGLATKFPSAQVLMKRSGQLWAFNQTVTVTQWLVAIILGAVVFVVVWPELNPAFGLIMPAGFMGGHGTATAMGNTFSELGWDDAKTLALTSATFGVFAAVVAGLAIIKYGVSKGLIKGITPFDEMEDSHKKGLLSGNERAVIGKETVASSSLDVITMHLALLLIVTVGAKYLSAFLSGFHDFVSVPVFACAFLLGSIIRIFLDKTELSQHFDMKIYGHAASTATDYLIVFGIASIKVFVLIDYALPLLALMFIGLSWCLFLLFYVAPRMLGDNWFEKGIFSWGWMTGTVAMGILLLRIADPDRETTILDDYAIAYVPGAVVDIILISFMPALIINGYVWESVGVLCAYLAVVQLINRSLSRKKQSLTSQSV